MNFHEAIPGTPVTINTDRDHWFDADKRQYMSYPAQMGYGSRLRVVEVVKVTKGGLIEVQVSPKHRMSFAPYHVDIWDSSLPKNQQWLLNDFYDRMIEMLSERDG